MESSSPARAIDTTVATADAGKPAAARTFRNPLKIQGADPWMTYYDGWYYLSTTTGGDVKLRRARHIADLATAPDTEVWKDSDPTRDREIWAAEFHLLDSGHGLRWYLYFTASDGKADDHHRMYVVESAGTDLMGPYTFKAKLLTDPHDAYYAIDGTVLKQANGRMYFFWCGRPSVTGQGLYISRMENPWTLTGPRTSLPADGFGYPVVREGPETLQHDGKVFLIYSMCGASTPDYRLGLLIANANDDLLQVSSWHQHPKVVFSRADQNGVYGPGHNFFFKSPDGKQDWIVYHAKGSTRDTYGDRTTRAQPFTWGADGIPNFGVPLSLDTDIPSPSGE